VTAPAPPPPPGFGAPQPPSPPPAGKPTASKWSRLGRTLRSNPTPNATANITIWSVCGLIWLLIITGIAFGQPPKNTPASG
jgi:hypothetical protein